MSEQYTISAVSERTRDYTANGKNLRVYYVKLEDCEPRAGVQAFELHQLETSKPPTAGLTIDVKTFQEGEFQGSPFVKIIKDFQSRQGGSSGGGGDKNFDRRPEHPRNEARMIHTAALGSAPEFYRLLREENHIPKPEGLAQAKEALLGIAAWLEGSYVLPASDAPAQAAQNGGGEVPADTAGLQPAAATAADDSIPF